MRILVLDTIHGGKVIADHLILSGHDVDMVDVYRHAEGITEELALTRKYDLVTTPVHLDPDYHLLKKITTPVISHHEMVRSVFPQSSIPEIIEITGKRGKSTTAIALAFLLSGPGILQTSSGLYSYPDKQKLDRFSITPASVLSAYSFKPADGWMIAEISLGFCGIGSLGILTSGDDYPVAGGKRSALSLKKESSHLLPVVLVPPEIELLHDGWISVSDLVEIHGKTASYQYQNIKGTFSNPLLLLSGYKTPLMLAAGAALLLGIDPAALSFFTAIPGRLGTQTDNGFAIIDNSNSGTCYDSSCDACRYGKEIAGDVPITLIIGQESQSVCENFDTSEIISAILEIKPHDVMLIPGDKRIKCDTIRMICNKQSIGFSIFETPEEAYVNAKTLNNPLILFSVKRWK